MAKLEPLDLSEARYELAAQPKVAKAIAKREILMPQQLLSAFGGGHFNASQINRLTADWLTTILSADQELFSDLRVLRARSRFLAKNNQYAAKFLRQVEKNVIGKDGITFQSKVKMQRGGGLAKDVNDEIEQAFKDWSKPAYCTVEGKMSRASVERFFIRAVAMDGEAIIRKVPLRDNPYLFALQFIDPDQLDHTFFLNTLPNGNQIRMGVEVDQYKKPVAYWLWKNHPSEINQAPNERVRVPASEILHCFIPLRIGQTRGIPWMCPAMFETHLLGGYKEAEVVAARAASTKMGFFTSQEGTQFTGDPALSETNLQTSGMAGQGPQLMDGSPGTLQNLPPGVQFQSWDPQHPTTAYAEFVSGCLRGIAAGLDVPYHELAQDLASVNFSSIRAGLLDARDTWELLQMWTVDSFCTPVYDAWLGNSIVSGALDLDASQLPAYKNGAMWHGRGWDWVDPLKDTTASVLAIQNGLSTLTRELAKQGLDLEEILEERKAELDLINKLGLTIGTDVKGDQADPNAPEDGAAPAPKGNKPVNGKPNGKASAYLT